MRISEHISYSEAVKSQASVRNGFRNEPDAAQLQCMIDVAEAIFEPVRTHFGVPIAVSSFFRNIAVNAVIGGTKHSQHTKGQAIDIDADVYGGISNREIFDFIQCNLEFDQLIWEFGDDDNPGWVHVSFVKNNNRMEVIKSSRIGYKTVYYPYKKS